MLRAEYFSDPAAFEEAVRPLIAADPDGAAVLSSVLGHLRATPPGGPCPLMCAVLDSGATAAAALRTPGHPMTVVLHPGVPDPEAVLDELVSAVLRFGEPVVGFAGRRSTTTRMAARWERRTGEEPVTSRQLLLHRLAELREPVGIPGEARVAVVADLDDLKLLIRWWQAFRTEAALGPAPDEPTVQMVLRGAARGDVVTLWCVAGCPVAAAGHAPVRNAACRIAPVYTPAEHRRRGYAAAVTAAAVRSARSLGASDITLFTDADYPPSNALYRRLGFVAVADFTEYALPG